MKALTLRQPWAYAICYLGKRVENRTWAPPATVLGEFIAIHAGQKYDDDALPWMLDRGLIAPEPFVCHYGAIVAVARVVGVVTNAPEDPWFVGPLGWDLEEVIVLEKPVPATGRQRIWELTADEELCVRARAPF